MRDYSLRPVLCHNVLSTEVTPATILHTVPIHNTAIMLPSLYVVTFLRHHLEPTSTNSHFDNLWPIAFCLIELRRNESDLSVLCPFGQYGRETALGVE